MRTILNELLKTFKLFNDFKLLTEVMTGSFYFMTSIYSFTKKNVIIYNKFNTLYDSKGFC